MNKLDTRIGDEIAVTVCYDYEPGEPTTYHDPGYDATIDITAVLIDGDPARDILDIINESALDRLIDECFDENT